MSDEKECASCEKLRKRIEQLEDKATQEQQNEKPL